jgi:alpha-2-macroglobulin
MLQALRLLAVVLLLTATAAAAAEVKPFAREDMASDAVRLTETLRIATAAIGAEVKGKTPEQLRKEAAAESDFGAAEKLAGAAVTAAPKDPANWLAYADVAVKADDAKADNRYDLVTRGATAAYAAYERSSTPEAQAEALAVLGDLLARHELWRPALDALKASLGRRDSIDVRKTYEAMRAEHGFRIVDYKVDNESASPASASIFPIRWRARPTSPLTSRSPAHPTPPSPTRTSSSASRA